MVNLLTWRRTLVAAALLVALPLLLGGRVAAILMFAVTVVTAATCLYQARRTPNGFAWLTLVGGSEAFGALICFGHVLGDNQGSYLALVSGAMASALYFGAAFAHMRARRPEGYIDGMLDGFAALAGLTVVLVQTLALQPGATALSIGGKALPVLALLLLVIVVRINVGLARDRRQNWRLQVAVLLAAPTIIIGSETTQGWSTAEIPLWTYSLGMIHSYLLLCVALHPDFYKIFLPELRQKQGTIMRWLGPAGALVATPMMFLLFIVEREVPTVWVGLACTTLTMFALWRGARVLRDREAGRRELKAEQKFRSLVEHSSDVILILDENKAITFASGGLKNLIGLEADEMVGRAMVDLLAPRDREDFLSFLFADSKPSETTTLRRDVMLSSLNIGFRWVTIDVTNHLATPSINGWVLNVHDVTERKEAERALSQLAMHDTLTGLPNRTQMRERLESSLKKAPGKTALLFCDLDGFKAVNDILGHEMGDEVLRAVAGRWSSQLRAHDLLGRWGGDEFLIICPDVKNLDQIKLIADRLLDTLREPLGLTNGTAQLGSSIGLALHDGTESSESLIGRADTAMYAAKKLEGGVCLA